MPRSLLPREHGAYAQLAAPLAGAFATFGASLAGALIALGACLAFVANEPLLVVLGHRGKRAKADDGRRAKRMLAILAPAAAITGLAGLALAPATIAVAAIVAAPACILVVLAWKRQERTLAGEVVAAVALSGAAAPVAVAAGASLHHAMWVWAAWAIGYGFTVVAVHRVIERHRKAATVVDLIAVVVAIASACVLAFASMVIALPLVACSIVLLLVAPSAKHLRAIGFVLVGASLFSITLGAMFA